MGDAAGQYDSPTTKGDAGTLADVVEPQDDADAAYVKQVDAWFREARAERAPYDHSWDAHRRYLGGDQWFNKWRPARSAKPAPNYTFANVFTAVPLMTENQPTINVVGRTHKSAKKADLMQDAVRYVFDRNKVEVTDLIVLVDQHQYGDGFAKIRYSRHSDTIEITSVDTRNVFPAPGGAPLQKLPHFQIAVAVPVADIERDYPEVRGRLKAGTWDESLMHKPVSTTRDQAGDAGYQNTTEGLLANASGTSTNDQDSRPKYATLIETWERDAKGNVFFGVVANGVVCRKRQPSPHRHRLYPFAQCRCYPVGSQFWSWGEVAQLISPQDGINRAEAYIFDFMRMASNPQMRIDSQSRVATKDITNRMGGFVRWDSRNGGQPPDWMSPPQVPPASFETLANQKRHMEDISGIHDSARGVREPGITSGVAIEKLQGATKGRLSLKTRMFERFKMDVAEQVIELIKQFWTNREIRVGRRYVSINVMSKDGKLDPKTDLTQDDFDVEVGVGSSLPVDKGVRFQQALDMYDRKAIARVTLLEKSGMSEDEIQRAERQLREEQQQAAKAAAPNAGEDLPAGDAKAVDAAEQELAGQEAAPIGGMPTEAEIAELEGASG